MLRCCSDRLIPGGSLFCIGIDQRVVFMIKTRFSDNWETILTMTARTVLPTRLHAGTD